MIIVLFLIIVGIVILFCVLGQKLSYHLGLPALLLFIGVGMLFGSDGILQIPFNDFALAEKICTVALIFIMFYGGFGTNWQAAKPVAAPSILLSTVGVLLTAGLTGAFCHFVLQMSWLEGLLIGSVLSSTDAASVFSILRSRKLNLKNNTASLLEVESGSNDPCAYMLTVILLAILQGQAESGALLYAVFAQVVYGMISGLLIAFLAGWLLKKFQFKASGFDTIFVFAIALLSYAVPAYFGGNGYLSAYLVGIILGNQKIPNKRSLVYFFDAFNGMMQILIFFLLGLLSFPSQMPAVFGVSIAIAVFLTVIARPLVVILLLKPFHASWRQQFIVAWAGLRGAASIVFAIMVVVANAGIEQDIFHIVFCVVLLSILFQGTLLAWVSKKLDFIDEKSDVLRTFNDYAENTEVQFIRLLIKPDNPWVGNAVKDIVLPPNTLLAAILRKGQVIVPKGNTIVYAGDCVILGAEGYLGDEEEIPLQEVTVYANNPWVGKPLAELKLPRNTIIILIRRDGQNILPDGNTEVLAGDVLVLYASA